MKSTKTSYLVQCAVLVALASALSLIPLWKMPLGGTLTPLSMLPICVLAIKLGPKWGYAAAFVYSVIQLLLAIIFDGILGYGLSALFLIGCILFDYLIPFTMLGISGVFRRYGTWGYLGGISLALIIRYACHIISGVVFFKSWCPWDNVILYSFAYNGTFMLPELILTCIGAFLLSKVSAFRRAIASVN